MKKEQMFPALLIMLDIGAAAVYWHNGVGWRKVVYWIAAAVLTATVTF